MPQGTFKKYLLRLGLSLSLATAVLWPPLPALAASDEAWMIAAQALTGLLSYQSTLQGMLDIGNNVAYQKQSLKDDVKENGEADDSQAKQEVDAVMRQLTTKGHYTLRVNSLPFVWHVNGSKDFNASCNPTDYVSINEGLVKGLRGNEDELAAVLAHEMTHGLEQHSARNYAKATAEAQFIGLLGMAAENFDWNKLNGLVNYHIAKNVTLPVEYEADLGGFDLMTSAGFNPGGPAAAMARMAHYLTYETQDVNEYQDLDDLKKDTPNYNDHPDMDKREAKLAAKMTAYSAGHVTVQNQRTVAIDGQPLLDATWDAKDYDNSTENAYLIAGALAKAFHDCPNFEAWNFRAGENGRVSYLDDNRVYDILKKAVERNHAEAKLESMVRAAYADGKDAKGRAALQKAEAQQAQKWQENAQGVLDAPQNLVARLRYNADMYSDEDRPQEALFLMARAFSAKNRDNVAEDYGIRGRAKAVAGDFDGALADCNTAVQMDAKNLYNFLNRADVYKRMGKIPQALADIQSAKAVDEKNAQPYKLEAEIEDAQGHHDQALAAWRGYHERDAKATDIPDDYFKEIDPEAFDKVQKERAKEKEKEQEAAGDTSTEKSKGA